MDTKKMTEKDFIKSLVDIYKSWKNNKSQLSEFYANMALDLTIEALIETKKDIEANATDTLWSHDGTPMTIVDRIEIVLGKVETIKKAMKDGY